MRAVTVELIRRRPLPEIEGDSSPSAGELSGTREALEGVIQRLDRMEEERDFYKELLDSSGTRREISPPPAEEDTSDVGPT